MPTSKGKVKTSKSKDFLPNTILKSTYSSWYSHIIRSTKRIRMQLKWTKSNSIKYLFFFDQNYIIDKVVFQYSDGDEKPSSASL